MTSICFALCFSAGVSGEEHPEQGAPLASMALRDGFHLLQGAGGNVVLWNGNEGALVVDAGTAEQAEPLLGMIERIAERAPRFVVNTHWHPDHVGGNATLHAAGALVIAHDRTRLRMSSRQVVAEYDLEVPAAATGALPELTFDDTLSLHLNGDRLVLLHVPAAHGDGDVIAWWEGANVAHLGDTYYAQGYPLLDTSRGGSLAGLVAAIETVLSRADADTVIVPGHGPASGRDALVAYRDMLVAIGRRVRELIEEGRNLDEVLAAQPAAPFDAQYGSGGVSAERFVRSLYEDLAGR